MKYIITDAQRLLIAEGMHPDYASVAAEIYALKPIELMTELSKPEQEPVATVQTIHGVTIGYLEKRMQDGTKLYLAAGAKLEERAQ